MANRTSSKKEQQAEVGTELRTAALVEALGLREGDDVILHAVGARALAVEKAPSVKQLVLNEFAAVARRKSTLAWSEIRAILGVIRAACVTHPLTEEIHDQGLDIAERYGFSMYDSTLVAAAQTAGCRILFSEDLQHRQVIDRTLTVRNPFIGATN